jgi:hypothetical protein
VDLSSYGRLVLLGQTSLVTHGLVWPFTAKK